MVTLWYTHLTNLENSKLEAQVAALEELVRRTLIIQTAYANPHQAKVIHETWQEYVNVAKSIEQDFEPDKIVH